MKYPTKPILEDCNQNFWQLASIQNASQGLPVILIGGQVAKEYGPGGAIIAVIIGNLLLWIIGLAMISMALQSRKNAIENVSVFLGKAGGILAALILMIAFLNWYILQIKTATTALSSVLQNYPQWTDAFSIRLGATFGLLTALLSIGGIRLIKWLCVILFPFLLWFILFAFFTSTYSANFNGTWVFSLHAIVTVSTVVLPGIINLPTFFRHAKSRADSFLALTIMIVFMIIFQSFTIIVGLSAPDDIFKIHNFQYGGISYIILASMFVIFALICVNLVNIYFASAGWEMIIPHKWTSKEYAIVGLLGTVAYTFLQVARPMEFLENMAESFISSLGVVLLMTFLMRIIVKHRPRPWEKLVSGACWLVGCITSLALQINTDQKPSEILLAGVSASILAFIFVIFVEETVWALRHLNDKTKNIKNHDIQ